MFSLDLMKYGDVYSVFTTQQMKQTMEPFTSLMEMEFKKNDSLCLGNNRVPRKWQTTLDH